MAEDRSHPHPAHPHPESRERASDAPPYGSRNLPAEEAQGGSGEVPLTPLDPEILRERVIAALRTIYDPEIPLNIYDLGLIYNIAIDGQSAVDIDMTLTAPGCPIAGPLVREVADAVGSIEGVSRSHVKLVWDPPWSRERMSEEAQLELGLL
jgi:FeS assembly SUF system protein